MGHHVTGIDLAEGAVQIALKNKRIDQGIVGNFVEYDFSENEFDAVLCVGVICVVFDLETFLKKIQFVLKPGGEVTLIDHNSQNPYVKLHFNRPDWVDKLVDRGNIPRHPMNPPMIQNASSPDLLWVKTAYFNHFTKHPKFIIDLAHKVGRTFFNVMKLLFTQPWTSNVIVMVGRKK